MATRERAEDGAEGFVFVQVRKRGKEKRDAQRKSMDPLSMMLWKRMEEGKRKEVEKVGKREG